MWYAASVVLAARVPGAEGSIVIVIIGTQLDSGKGRHMNRVIYGFSARVSHQRSPKGPIMVKRDNSVRRKGRRRGTMSICKTSDRTAPTTSSGRGK